MDDSGKLTIGAVRISVEERDGDRTQLFRHLKGLGDAGAQRLFQDTASRTAPLSDRPGLKEALELIQSDRVSRLLIPDVIRLTTDQGLLSQVIRICRRHKVEIIALNLGLDITTDTGMLMATVIAAGGTFEHSQTRGRIRRNSEFERNNNLRNRGGVRFGFRRRKGLIELDTVPFLCLLANGKELSKAQIALHQIELFESLRSSTQTIAAVHDFYGIGQAAPAIRSPLLHSLTPAELDSLRRQRYFVSSVFRWTEAGFLDWIRDPALCGDRVLAKYEIAEDETGRRYKKRLLRRDEWEIEPDAHPGLISRDRHAAILKILAGHSIPRGSASYSSVNLFKGMLWCEECGSVMCLQSGGNRSGGGRYYAYQCTLWIKGRAQKKKNAKAIVGCTQRKTVRLEDVENAIVDFLAQRAQEILTAAKSINENPDGSDPDSPEIAELRSSIVKLRSFNDPDLAGAIESKENKLRQLIATTLQQQDVRQTNDAAIVKAFENPNFWSYLAFEEKKETLQELIDRVTCKDGKVVKITLR